MSSSSGSNDHWHNVNVMHVNLRKLLSAHKSHVRETSLFTGAIYQIKSAIAKLLVSFQCQVKIRNPYYMRPWLQSHAPKSRVYRDVFVGNLPKHKVDADVLRTFAMLVFKSNRRIFCGRINATWL